MIDTLFVIIELISVWHRSWSICPYFFPSLNLPLFVSSSSSSSGSGSSSGSSSSASSHSGSSSSRSSSSSSSSSPGTGRQRHNNRRRSRSKYEIVWWSPYIYWITSESHTAAHITAFAGEKLKYIYSSAILKSRLYILIHILVSTPCYFILNSTTLQRYNKAQ